MSYRTYINEKQVFGNHECYKEWIDFLKKQGIDVNEENEYDGYITDFMGALQVIEDIVLNMEKQRMQKNSEIKSEKCKYSSLFDWSHIPTKLENEDKNDKFHTSLFDELFDIVETGYAFLPFAFFLACKDKLEKAKPYSVNGYFHCYKLKDGEKIHVYGR